jgi:hypothetical protein
MASPSPEMAAGALFIFVAGILLGWGWSRRDKRAGMLLEALDDLRDQFDFNTHLLDVAAEHPGYERKIMRQSFDVEAADRAVAAALVALLEAEETGSRLLVGARLVADSVSQEEIDFRLENADE